jgi:hypothetical protein
VAPATPAAYHNDASVQFAAHAQHHQLVVTLDKLDWIHWILFEILATIAPLVTLVYWTMIYPTVCQKQHE